MSGYSSVDTFSSLVDEVITSLQGFGVNNDLVCSLASSIGAADTLIGVDDQNAVSKGIIEIDEELVYVNSNASGTLTIPAWGRGWKGTTATAHAAGAAVYVSPTYPRSIVSREVNNTIRAVYPDLFAVKTYDFTADATNWQYSLPADVDRVLSVEVRWTTQDGWMLTDSWDMAHSANTTDYATGKFLSLSEPYRAGVKVHVTYAAQPTLLINSSDTFSVTGLPTSSRDVVVLGAGARLIGWLDAGRVPSQTVASDALDQTKPVGNAVSLAREIRTNYTSRLQAERRALLSRYPIRSRRTR